MCIWHSLKTHAKSCAPYLQGYKAQADLVLSHLDGLLDGCQVPGYSGFLPDARYILHLVLASPVWLTSAIIAEQLF